jgi:CheY-like chemotaxis protein
MSEAMNTRRMRRLLDVARSVFAEPQPELVYQRLLEAARELTGARYAALGVLNERRTALERLYTAGIDDETRRAIGDLPRGRGVLGLLVDHPESLRIEDIGRHPASYGFPPGHPVMRSFLGVPVHVRGEVCGNLYLADKPGAFDESDEEIALILGDWAGATIELARSRHAAGRRWRDREPAPVLAATTVADPSDARTTLLVVANDPALRELVLTTLEQQGYTVLAAANELDALELAGQHQTPIDLLITDLVMASLSGPELAQRLRELRPGIEVLFMSGLDDSRLFSREVERGEVNLLTMPFTPGQLIDRVRALT